jgi:hypothetical protein
VDGLKAFAFPFKNDAEELGAVYFKGTYWEVYTGKGYERLSFIPGHAWGNIMRRFYLM